MVKLVCAAILKRDFSPVNLFLAFLLFSFGDGWPPDINDVVLLPGLFFVEAIGYFLLRWFHCFSYKGTAVFTLKLEARTAG